MQASNVPSKIQLPFATSGDKVTIPVPSQIPITDGRASFTTGFVPLNATPLSAGGVAPFMSDMNGVLNQVTAIQQWQSAGGLFKYDAAFSASVGGYPKGAVLSDTAGTGSWLSIVDNNTTNPDTGGAGWVKNSSGRLTAVTTINASATYIPTPGISYVIVEVQGGGGAAGGTPATGAGQVSVAGGGASGSYAKSFIAASSLGTSVAVTIGAGGAAVVGGAGGAGGTTTFGSLVSCPGGGGAVFSGVAVAISASSVSFGGGPIGTPTGGTIISASSVPGAPGLNVGGGILSGSGGGSPIDHGGNGAAGVGARASGISAIFGSGAGGSGACAGQNDIARAGGAGGSGRVIIYEYS